MTDMNDLPIDLVTVTEAAAIAGRKPGSIRHAIRTGALPLAHVARARGRGRFYVSLTDLRRVYPPATRGPNHRAHLIRLTDEQDRAALSEDGGLAFNRTQSTVNEQGEVIGERPLTRPNETEAMERRFEQEPEQ